MEGGRCAPIRVAKVVSDVAALSAGEAHEVGAGELGTSRRDDGGAGVPAEPEDVLPALAAYLRACVDRGIPVKHVTRHVLGLFQGQPRARAWRRHLSENAHLPGAGPEVVEQALQFVN